MDSVSVILQAVVVLGAIFLGVRMGGIGLGLWGAAGGDLSAADFAASADLLDGVQLVGSPSVGTTLWSQPSISVIGLDMTSIAGSSNVLIPEVKAKISMRIVPGSDPVAELDALVRRLESHAPWGAHVTVERTKEAPQRRTRSSCSGGPRMSQRLASTPPTRASTRPRSRP